jgi:hypothetical protein
MPSSIEYASFLIRLWRDQPPQADKLLPAWQAEVEHIQSGQHWSFVTFEDLISFLYQQVEVQTIVQNKNGQDLH